MNEDISYSLKEEITEIEDNISKLRGNIKNEWHQTRLYVCGILGMAILEALANYWAINNVHLLIERSDAGFPVFAVFFSDFFVLSVLISFVSAIIIQQTKITSWKAEIDGWQTRKSVASQFAKNTEKPSYFDSLVRINVENLTAYYKLVKEQTDNSYKIVVNMCMLGFILIGVGVVVGFVNLTHINMITYISSGSGVLIEAISSIFFALHSRTVRQMKVYHNNLLAVQNVLLSFKLIENSQDESEKAKMIGQMVAHLINKQEASNDPKEE